MNREIKITFITPCFCRGADCSENGQPEIRPPSIRGQLHWWFRALGGAPQDENAIFGSVHGGKATASPLVVRVRYPLAPRIAKSPTLPHKPNAPAEKNALAPGTAFDLLLSTRLGGLTPVREKQFTRALEAWLLMGAFGLRATRGGGNFTYEGQPTTAQEYTAAVQDVIRASRLKFALLSQNYPTADAARRDITDTLADEAFGGSAPLGKIKGGRKTSPLRFRVVQFAPACHRIAAIWDGRQAVTSNTDHDLTNAINTLAARKPIGKLLAAVPPR